MYVYTEVTVINDTFPLASPNIYIENFSTRPKTFVLRKQSNLGAGISFFFNSQIEGDNAKENTRIPAHSSAYMSLEKVRQFAKSASKRRKHDEVRLR